MTDTFRSANNVLCEKECQDGVEKSFYSVFSDNFPYDHGYIMELTFTFKISQREGIFSHCHGTGGLSKS